MSMKRQYLTGVALLAGAMLAQMAGYYVIETLASGDNHSTSVVATSVGAAMFLLTAMLAILGIGVILLSFWRQLSKEK